MRFKKTYEKIRASVLPDTIIDSLEVAEQVEEYRQFRKPEKTKVVLLAESYVYTDDQDFTTKCDESILHKIARAGHSHFSRAFQLVTACSSHETKNNNGSRLWEHLFKRFIK